MLLLMRLKAEINFWASPDELDHVLATDRWAVSDID
jgi:hypothetical protein